MISDGSNKSSPVESIDIQRLSVGKTLQVDQTRLGSHDSHDQPMGAQQCKQVSQCQEVVTEAEAEELASMVDRMKHMAMDIQMEQDSQLESIDSLTSKVQLTTDRLKSDTSRMKRLL